MPEFDKKQIERGVEIEKEHKPTLDKIKNDVKEHGRITLSPRDVYESISEDHLDEFKDYYTSLVEMENESKERSSKEIQKRIEEGPDELEEAAHLLLSIRESSMQSLMKKAMSEEDIKKLSDEKLARGIYWWTSLIENNPTNEDVKKNLQKVKEWVLQNPYMYPKSIKILQGENNGIVL